MKILVVGKPTLEMIETLREMDKERVEIVHQEDCENVQGAEIEFISFDEAGVLPMEIGIIENVRYIKDEKMAYDEFRERNYPSLKEHFRRKKR